MTLAERFLHADAALREVIDPIDPADFTAPVPAEWSQLESSTLLWILGRHAYDEAWVSDVIAGRATFSAMTRSRPTMLSTRPPQPPCVRAPPQRPSDSPTATTRLPLVSSCR